MYGQEQVECPRCGKRRSLALHQVVTTDGKACDRCWGKDRVAVPMVPYPPGTGPQSVLGTEPEREAGYRT